MAATLIKGFCSGKACPADMPSECSGPYSFMHQVYLFRDGTFDLYGCHGTSVCIPLLPSPSLVSYWCRYQYILPIMYCGLHTVHGLQSGRHDAIINQHSREKHCAILFNGSGFVYLCRSIDSSINRSILMGMNQSINYRVIQVQWFYL